MQFRIWLESEQDLTVGRVIQIPAQAGRYPFSAQIIKVQGDNVWMRRVSKPDADVNDDMAGGNPFKMSRAAVKHWVNDLSGRVEVKGKSDDPWVNKVLSGEAKYIGKGDDGVVFDAGDMVVKVSSTVPFHPDSQAQRLPSQGAKMLFMNARLVQLLHKQGIPGILPVYTKIVGDKVFVVMPKVQIGTATRDQIKEVKASIEAIHKAGYSINDEIQVGLWNGRMYHFDLGKMAKISHKEDVSDDWGHFERWAEKSGWVDPMKRWEYIINMLTHWHTDWDDPRRAGYIRKLIAQKQLMDKEYPERKIQTAEEMEQIVDS